MQPLAQIGLGLAMELGARIVLHAFHGSFSGEPRRHCFAQPAQPAPVVREQPERLKYVAMLAGTYTFAFDKAVKRMAHGVNCIVEPLVFPPDIFGNDMFDDDARLMQDNMAK